MSEERATYNAGGATQQPKKQPFPATWPTKFITFAQAVENMRCAQRLFYANQDRDHRRPLFIAAKKAENVVDAMLHCLQTNVEQEGLFADPLNRYNSEDR